MHSTIILFSLWSFVSLGQSSPLPTEGERTMPRNVLPATNFNAASKRTPVDLVPNTLARRLNPFGTFAGHANQKRQSSCNTDEVMCTDGGGGCCPSESYCTDVDGQAGCCPIGETCSGISNTCANEGYSVCKGSNMCCPTGDTCELDSLGDVVSCQSGYGSGSGSNSYTYSFGNTYSSTHAVMTSSVANSFTYSLGAITSSLSTLGGLQPTGISDNGNSNLSAISTLSSSSALPSFTATGSSSTSGSSNSGGSTSGSSNSGGSTSGSSNSGGSTSGSSNSGGLTSGSSNGGGLASSGSDTGGSSTGGVGSMRDSFRSSFLTGSVLAVLIIFTSL